MKAKLILSLFVLALVSGSMADTVIGDFEDGSYDGWDRLGDCYFSCPVLCDLGRLVNESRRDGWRMGGTNGSGNP